jgi:hypothetical protein
MEPLFDSSCDWEDASNYTYTGELTRDGWAWEFLRRNRDYQALARTPRLEQRPPRQLTDKVRIIEADRAHEAAAWGLRACERADRAADEATVFWRGDLNAHVLPVETRPAPRPHPDAFDILQLGCRVAILRVDDDAEHVLIEDGPHRIQLEARGVSLLDGPVLLHYDLRGFDSIEPKLHTVRQLIALRRLGRFPHSLFPPERRARRWTIALRALDASRVGAHSRDIAAAIFGIAAVRRDWDGASDYLRSRVRRAIAAGACLAGGGHKALLRGSQLVSGSGSVTTP